MSTEENGADFTNEESHPAPRRLLENPFENNIFGEPPIDSQPPKRSIEPRVWYPVDKEKVFGISNLHDDLEEAGDDPDFVVQENDFVARIDEEFPEADFSDEVEDNPYLVDDENDFLPDLDDEFTVASTPQEVAEEIAAEVPVSIDSPIPSKKTGLFRIKKLKPSKSGEISGGEDQQNLRSTKKIRAQAEKEEVNSRKKIVKWILIGFGVLLAIAIGTALAFFSKMAIVTSAVGVTNDSLNPCESFNSSGLVCTVDYMTNPTVKKNNLISQSLESGTYVEKGSPLKLVYSKGPESSLFPLVVGKNLEEAKANISDIGGSVSIIETVSDNPQFKSGEVVEAILDGTGLPIIEGTTVTNGFSVKLKVSSGESTVPNFIGKTRDQITADATKLGWKITFEEAESEFVPGLAYQQDPSADTLVPNDTDIKITVAKEPSSKQVKVPDVVGKSKIEAQTELSAEGFKTITTVEVENCKVTGNAVVTQVVPGVGKISDTSNPIVIIVSKPGKCTG